MAKKSLAAQKVKKQQTKKPADKQPPIPAQLTITWRTAMQKKAWLALPRKPITFLLGTAGSGKTFLAMAYAINEILGGRKEHIVLTRPIVESGEKLGFLPGTFGEKVNPYMQPLYDTMDVLLGKNGAAREIINRAVKLAPLCYMRGRTFNDSICILDESQNATYQQFKLFLSRFGANSQVLVTGDPRQSDLHISPPPLVDILTRLKDVGGVQSFEFAEADVVRHPLIGEILKRL
jgi:phosphate starvation-inducible PhoH-like protein